MKNSLLTLGAGLALATGATASSAQNKAKAAPGPLVISKASPAIIVLPAAATPPEETAATEVRDYLSRITGADFKVVRENAAAKPAGVPIYIGATRFAAGLVPAKPAFADEEWLMQTQGKAIVLTGGAPRGTLYGAYRFLEDICGVNWWNPWEESVPSRPAINVPQLKRRGQPAINYRDIYALFSYDGGRFAARTRLDRQGFEPVDMKYGGSRDYGPPSHAHTLFEYINPDKYYTDHPEWFLVNQDRMLVHGGKPNDVNSQLDLSNQEMRVEFLRLLRENIRSSRKAAIEKQLPPPDVFAISQNDGGTTFVGPGHKDLVAREGTDAAAIIDFVNYMADGIREEFPTVLIDTLAYNQSEKAPRTLRPRDNVVIRLADTPSNLLLPITHPRNHKFRENVEAWAKISKNLRIWDYGVSFTNFNMNLPMPTIRTYAPDIDFFLKHNVKGIFIEIHDRALTDQRDMKVWVLSRLMEDPKRKTADLVRQFTDGFYGAGGSYVRRYQALLEKTVDDIGAISGPPEVAWFASLSQYTYLTTSFLQQANAIMDQGAAAVAKDPVLSRRMRHARFSLDYAIMMRYPRLIGDWVRNGKSPEAFPFDTKTVADRLLQTWTEQAEIRYNAQQRPAELTRAQNQVAALKAAARYTALPDQFKNIPPANIYTYGFADAKVYGDTFIDPTSPSGVVRRIVVLDNQIEKYKTPTTWGVYADNETTTLVNGNIKDEEVTRPGYNWYKLGKVKPTASSYVFFTWSWHLQFVIGDTVDKRTPDGEVELWANIKFDGPLYPHGKADEKNTVSVDRVVAIRR